MQGWRLEGGRGQAECGKLEGPPTHPTPLQNLQKIFSLKILPEFGALTPQTSGDLRHILRKLPTYYH